MLGLGLSYSLSGSMACSLSMAGSECGGRDCGNPNIKREEKKSKAPQSRKPPHQAPIQRGSSGVMSRLPAMRKKQSQREGVQRGRVWLSCFGQQHRWADGLAKGLRWGHGTPGKAACRSPWVPLFLPKLKTRLPSRLNFLVCSVLVAVSTKTVRGQTPSEFSPELTGLAELSRCANNNTRKQKHGLFQGTFSLLCRLTRPPQKAANLRSHSIPQALY